jgi:hypothetical protein
MCVGHLHNYIYSIYTTLIYITTYKHGTKNGEERLTDVSMARRARQWGEGARGAARGSMEAEAGRGGGAAVTAGAWARARGGGEGGGVRKNNERGPYITLCKCSLPSAHDMALGKDFF